MLFINEIGNKITGLKKPNVTGVFKELLNHSFTDFFMDNRLA